MKKALVVADDLTGAMDAAAQFAIRGLKTELVLQLDAAYDQDAEVIAIDTESRNLPAAEAMKKVRTALESLLPIAPACLLFKKIDSTLRGNVGAELDALLSIAEGKAAVVAPAFPANDRIIVGGHVLVEQIPLLKSYAGLDVHAPVHSSYLPELLKRQTDKALANIRLQQLEKGIGTVRLAYEQALAQDREIILCDSSQQEDLDLIVEAIWSNRNDVVWVGSAGLAQALASRPKPGPCPGDTGRLPWLKGKTLILYGSPNQVCLEQISYLKAQLPSVPVKPVPETIIRENSSREQVINKYIDLLKDKEVAVMAVTSSNLPLDLGAGPGVASAIKDFLSLIAKRATEEAGVTNLIISGGDTAWAVFERLEVIKLGLQDELLPGVPVAKATTLGGRELAVLTKAGGFGPPDTLVQAIVQAQK